jgi:molybdopterin converting factor small subunit
MKSRPKVRVTLSPTLRQLSQITDEPEVFEIKAASALECLQIMLKRYPSMRKWAYKDGRLLPIIWFFVNDAEMREKIPPDQLTKPLSDGDEVTIFFGKL